MNLLPFGFLSAALFALSAVPDATPSNAPPPTPTPSGTNGPTALLREIGHVTATSAFCKAIIDHAVTAVALGMDNDRRIKLVVQTLRTSDFDSNALVKNRSLIDLTNQNVSLTEQSVAAEKAAKALRVDAAMAPTPLEAAQLVSFADALDGALHRQRTIARDLTSMIAIFNAHPIVNSDERAEAVIEEQMKENERGNVTFFSAEDRVPPLLSWVASDNADQIVAREGGIAHDEASAADLVAPVFGGC